MAKQVQSEADRLAAEELEKNAPATKGHATPTRREREAARKRPLVGGRTPEARSLTKEQQRAARDRARVGMANGEDKYLTIRDRGPPKRFLRDYVDSRWGFAELTIPVLVVVLVIGFFVPALQYYVNYAFYVIVALVIIDCIYLTVTARKRLRAKFGADRVERIGLYPSMRAIQLRAMRLPKPQVKRGQQVS